MSSRVTGDTGDAASDRGYTSDSELYGGTAVTSNSSAPNLMTTSSNSDLSTDQTWIMVQPLHSLLFSYDITLSL